MDATALANIWIHGTQFPAAVEAELKRSLRDRKLNHKFLYEGNAQTQRWLRLHEAHSPARTDPAVQAIYQSAFRDFLQRSDVAIEKAALVSLGCGGGQKDLMFLRLAESRALKLAYVPCDVSVAMALSAHLHIAAALPRTHSQPLVFDLEATGGLDTLLDSFVDRELPRIFLFFGMIPNFEPEAILPKLKRMVRTTDSLLLSANLAPGADYEAGVRQILPQYDNDLMREWLRGFLIDLGVPAQAGEIQFSIQASQKHPDLQRVQADFIFNRAETIPVHSEDFHFDEGDTFRLFFSYRYSPAILARVLQEHGLFISQSWIAPSEEEGVFLVQASMI